MCAVRLGQGPQDRALANITHLPMRSGERAIMTRHLRPRERAHHATPAPRAWTDLAVRATALRDARLRALDRYRWDWSVRAGPARPVLSGDRPRCNALGRAAVGRVTPPKDMADSQLNPSVGPPHRSAYTKKSLDWRDVAFQARRVGARGVGALAFRTVTPPLRAHPPKGASHMEFLDT